jgi:Dolichyl-phosphate-mannose-protein mannosyltransferase
VIKFFTRATPSWRRALPTCAAVVVTIYGAVLRLDALVGRYGTVDHPRWARWIERLSALAPALKPKIYAWPRVANPYVGGDPISYLGFAREMRSFYQPHVREPIFLALTRAWLLLLDNQDIAVGFASMTGSIAAIVGTYLLGAAACSPAVGLLAAGALAIDYDAIGWAPDGWRDDTFAAAFVFALWAIVRLRQRPSVGNAVLAGCLGAVACLTRVTALSFLVPTLLWVAFTAHTDRRRAIRVTLVAAGLTAILIAPYLINCARAFGDPLVAINVHTQYYRYSEGLPSERTESATRYLAGKFQRRPLYETDTALEGLFIRPLTIKWSGFDVWLQGTSRALASLSVIGLALFAATADGRLLLIACFTALVPYAFTWNIAGGGEWRFTMHAYPVFLIAAFFPFALLVRAVRPSWRAALVHRRRDLALAGACAVMIVAVLTLHRKLPYYIARESLAAGHATNFIAGPRDEQFFTQGWSPWHVEGNVTVRVTIGERSEVLIPLPAEREYMLTLRADPVRADQPQTLNLLFNHRVLRTLELAWDPNRVGTYRITVPASYTHAGTNDLLIIPSRTIRAGDAGERFQWIDPALAIGTRVWYVRMEPVTESRLSASPAARGQI